MQSNQNNAQATENTVKRWVDVNEIQEKYLPISKKAIRKLIKENLDTVRYGKKLLVERKQLEDYLRNEC